MQRSTILEVRSTAAGLCTAICVMVSAVLPGCFTMDYLPTGGGAKGEPDIGEEVVRFPTTDGLTLEGRFYAASLDQRDIEMSAEDPAYKPSGERLPPEFDRTVVLFCHGVRDNNTSAMGYFLSQAGFRVFQFDYRSFGHSDKGQLSDRALAEDSFAALQYLRTRPDVDPDRILVYGHSMGGVYAMAVGALAHEAGAPVRGVISNAAFSNWREVAGDLVPVFGHLFGGVVGNEPTDYARRLGKTPLLIVHTEADTDILPKYAYRLYNAAKERKVPATLLIHPTGGHTWPFWGEPLLEKQIVEWAKFRMLNDHDDRDPIEKMLSVPQEPTDAAATTTDADSSAAPLPDAAPTPEGTPQPDPAAP